MRVVCDDSELSPNLYSPLGNKASLSSLDLIPLSPLGSDPERMSS